MGSIIYDTANAAAYTIGSGVAGSQTLTLNNGLVGGNITLNSTLTQNQVIAANLLLFSATANTSLITNSGTTSLTLSGTVLGGTGGTAGTKILNVSGSGAVNFTNALTNGGATALNLSAIGTSGTVTLSGAVTSNLGTLRATGTNAAIVVNGQTVNVANASTYGSSTNGSSLLLQSGTVNFNGGLTTNTNDGVLFKITGGSFSASSLTLQRTASFTTLPAASSTTSGLVVAGGTANISGILDIGTNNSSASALVAGGNLTVGGEVRIANNSLATGRYSVLQVSGGTFTSTDTVGGIILNRSSSQATNAELLLTGGVSTAERISFGVVTSGSGSTGTMVLNGASAELYVGSGGIVKTSTNAYTSAVNLTAGTLGAKANWASSVDMNLNGGNVNLKVLMFQMLARISLSPAL